MHLKTSHVRRRWVCMRRMRQESETSKYAREAAATRVQREASATRAVRSEMEKELNDANVAAANAKRDLEIARRLQHDADARCVLWVRAKVRVRVSVASLP